MFQKNNASSNIINLVKRSEQLAREGHEDWTIETDDSILKYFMLKQLLKKNEDHSRYIIERAKFEWEEKRDILIIILSTLGLILTFIAIPPFFSLLNPNLFHVGIFLIYLSVITYLLFGLFGTPYKTALIQELDTGFIGSAFISDLIKNFNESWMVGWSREGMSYAKPKSLIEKYEKDREIDIEKRVYAIRKSEITKNNRILIGDIGANLDKYLQGITFETILYLCDQGWRRIFGEKESNLYYKFYFAYDHTGVIKASQYVKTNRKYPRINEKGFYKVKGEVVNVGKGFELLITEKSYYDLNEEIIKNIEK